MGLVEAAYNPFEVKEFSLVLDPLPGYETEAEGIAAAWDLIRQDTTNKILVLGTFSVAGESGSYTVEVRRKSSRALPSEENPQKVGLKIGFLSPSTWNGVSRLSLENGGDISPIAEGLAWNLHQLAEGEDLYGEGFNPGLASWVNLSVNGQNLGVYTSVEQRNKQFLRNRGVWPSNDTWLYKGDDIGNPVLEAGLEAGSPAMETLCFFPFRPAASACPTPSDSELANLLPQLIDMDAMLTQAAVDAFTGNNDALMSKGKNFHFIDVTAQPRRYYPWDLDAVFGKGGASNIYATTTSNKRGKISYSQSGYQSLILNHPDFRRSFNTKVESMFGVSGVLSPTTLSDFLHYVQLATEPYLLADPYVGAVIGESPSAHFDGLRQWIDSRAANVLAQVQQNIPAPRADYPKFDNPVSESTLLSSDSSLQGKTGSQATFRFKLSVASGAGAPQQVISLSLNKTSYSAVTDDAGVATFTVKLPNKAGTYPATVSFGGAVGLSPTSELFQVVVTR
jgi:hypothetical protein